MASNTENLNLLMKNPSTDGADTFNVQTMLNDNWQKIDNNAGTVAQTLANILKPTTPPIIGLPPSTTPDGMFQALGNTGELHVWRKTVTTAQEQPAGYTLGDVVTGSFFLGIVNVGNKNRIYKYATSPKVGDNGTVYIDSDNTITIGKYGDSFSTIANTLPGKFVIGTGTDGVDMTEPFTVVFYIPSDAQITDPSKTGHIYVDKYQPVTGYAKVPAGTTTTYPVSTNPNAYQEGSDAKPAGYTLGEVVTGSFCVGYTTQSNGSIYWSAGDISVAEDGTLSLLNAVSENVFGSSSNLSWCNANMKGKFAWITSKAYVSRCDFDVGKMVFIPSDAVFSRNAGIYVDKYQEVTGYAAIPAGTTIEYLGKLGDKARVQVVSYVGTGTYGSDHPNSLTFDFVPKVVIVNGYRDAASYTNTYSIILSPQSGGGVSMLGADRGYVYWVICEATDRTVSWYAYDYVKQLNESGMKYVAVAIG